MFIKRGSIDQSVNSQGAIRADGAREKTEEELLQDLLERKAAKLRKKEEQLEIKGDVEQLKYMDFPNIMGWYFDGQFTKSFSLHEEYAEYFKDLEDELDAQKDLKIEETFTEKVARNFWPPVYHGGKYFRTRGIYLDFKEVKEDPPKESPKINFEKTRGMITEGPAETAAETTVQKLLLGRKKKSDKTSIKHRQERLTRRKLIKKQQKLERELEYLNKPTMLGWYFDGFFPAYFQLYDEYATIFNQMEVDMAKAKQTSIKETFAEKAKRYFWPPDPLGQVCFRTRGIYLDSKDVMQDPPHTPPEIVLERRMQEVTRLLEEESKFRIEEEELPMSSADLALEEAKVIDMIKNIDDDNTLSAEEKAAKKRQLFLAFQKKRHMSRLQMWIEADYQNKAIHKHIYYFDDQIPGFFRKKPIDRDKYYYDSTWDVWRIKRTIIYFPNDFYWDDALGMFFPKDRSRPADFYVYDHELELYRPICELTPPILPNRIDITPSDFYFDYGIGKWMKKPKASEEGGPEFYNNGKRFCLNRTVDTPDDFYFDFKTHQFERKAENESYFYDPSFGAWRKHGPIPPAKGAQKPIHFYWNEIENKFVKKDAPSSFFIWDQNSKFFRKKKSLNGRFHPKNWTWDKDRKVWRLKKFSSGQSLISRTLYWRPDRDYDKPWLEYVGGYRDYHIEYDYDRIFYEQDGGTSKFSKKTTKEQYDAEKSRDADAGKREKGGKHDMFFGKGGKNTTTSTGKDTGKKLKFSSSDPALKSPGIKMVTMGETEAKSTHEITKPGIIKGSPTHSENDAFVEPLDRKTLKVVNLGTLITDTDLRKYFASVKKIVRPKKPGTDDDEEYAFLKFKTEEAAAAALRTMHLQKIRGLHIKLAYKLKAEDEHTGGHPELTELAPVNYHRHSIY